VKIIDGLRKYDDSDLRIAAELLNRVEWDVKFATDLLIYADAMRDLLGLEAPSEERPIRITEAEPSEDVAASHDAEQHDAEWFYKGMSSDVGTEQITG
jgi:hypothetical protein